jgi:dihydroxyacetone kinase-like predicted kinase
MTLGTVTKAAIENLIAQMEEIEHHASPSNLTQVSIEPGQIAVVAVAPGRGIGRVFASLGAAAIIEGGQTMNPSTQEIINAFENLPTDKVIILPNNKNIFLAAQAAVEMTVKNVRVIPCRTVPQGLAAMLRIFPDGDLDQVSTEMIAALDDVETGEITIATRSVVIDGIQVQEGSFIALHNGKLVLSTATLDEAVISLLEHVQVEDYELITFFSGSDCRKQDVDRVVDKVRSQYPNQDVEVQNGGQPHYPFIISIE